MKLAVFLPQYKTIKVIAKREKDQKVERIKFRRKIQT